MQTFRFPQFKLLSTAALGAAAILAAAAPSLGAAYPQPIIASFSPASGPAGTVITVTGSGFTGLDLAWIGNGHDGTVTVLNDGVVEVTVPADATTAHVGILNPQNAAFSPNNFTVTAAAAKSVAATPPPAVSTATAGSSATPLAISGTVSGAKVVTVAVEGAATKTITPNADGSFSATGLASGNYTLVPHAAGYIFTPVSRAEVLGGTSIGDVMFYAMPTSAPSYTLAGTVSGVTLAGVYVTLTGTNVGSTVTDAGGNYSFSGLPSGTYRLTAYRENVAITGSRLVTIGSADSLGNDFTSTTPTGAARPVMTAVSTLPEATVGVAYESTLVAGASGGVAPYHYESHSLNWWAPPGMSVDASGNLTGTPTKVGTYGVSVDAVDAAGNRSAPHTAIVTVAPARAIVQTTIPGPLKISVSGNHLVDGNGNTVQLRGVNVSGLESVAMFGWDPSDPWGSQTGDATPNWSVIKTWKANAVRLPLNEASWLGYTCVDATGASRNPDPGHNYQATVQQSVAGATAAGLYVILDLHWTAPGNACPMAQNPMADADHSVAFWSSLASAFKGNPNVIFELFNEPFLDQSSLEDSTPWADLLNGGGTFSSYLTGGSPGVIDRTWKNAGMQQMLDAVRATGATNVVLTSAVAWSSAMGGWLQYKPTDPAKQLGAVWHAYSAVGSGYPKQASCWGLPACSATIMQDVQGIIAAGYPVVITEYGDSITPTSGDYSPFASMLLPFADANGVSYLGWTWDIWPGYPGNVLITDEQGTPTDGFGTYVKEHYLCVGAGTSNCK
jgi:aryl-phospho-beta-D-glucosidase BglC (GH1 family)